MKELEKLAVALKLLTAPDNWEILTTLKIAGRLISYSEIYREMRRHFGKNYNPNQLWRNLKKLKEADLIVSKKKISVNPETGKTRVCFYEISNYGKILIEKYIQEIFGIIQPK